MLAFINIVVLMTMLRHRKYILSRKSGEDNLPARMPINVTHKSLNHNSRNFSIPIDPPVDKATGIHFWNFSCQPKCRLVTRSFEQVGQRLIVVFSRSFSIFNVHNSQSHFITQIHLVFIDLCNRFLKLPLCPNYFASHLPHLDSRHYLSFTAEPTKIKHQLSFNPRSVVKCIFRYIKQEQHHHHHHHHHHQQQQ